MAAAKKTAGPRASARKKTFDERRAEIIANRSTSGRFEWEAYGVTWQAKRPNLALVGELEEQTSIGSFTNYLIAHIDEAQREEFLAALVADEELDIDIIEEMATELQELVYAETPTKPSGSS